jgi:hypothetical protein
MILTQVNTDISIITILIFLIITSERLDSPQNTMEIPTSGDQIMQQIIQSNNASSTLRTIPLSIQEPDSSLPRI